MSIRVTCEQCGKTLKAPDEAAGKRAKCPGCGHILRLPEPEPKFEFYDLDEPAESHTASTERVSPRSPHPSWMNAGVPKGAASYEPMREEPRLAPSSGTMSAIPRRYLYWGLLVAFVPLAFSLLGDDGADEQRITHTIVQYQDKIDQLPDSADETDFFALFPGNRFEGALLPYGSKTHWLYAALSAAGFFGLMILCFDLGQAKYSSILGAGLFTAVVGVLSLLLFQYIAEWTQGYNLIGRSILVILFYIVKFIGFSYRCAMDPESGFLLSTIGFTLGVGLCEEFIKAAPVLWRAGAQPALDWRGACIWGLASGVGFGVAEGVIYSADFYNGVSTGGIYVVRFVSCVGLHAVWGASVGIAILHVLHKFTPGDFWGWLQVALLAMLVPMVLHGLYDTLLKKEMNAGALLVALLSFGWLAFQIERSHRMESQGMLGAVGA